MSKGLSFPEGMSRRTGERPPLIRLGTGLQQTQAPQTPFYDRPSGSPLDHPARISFPDLPPTGGQISLLGIAKLRPYMVPVKGVQPYIVILLRLIGKILDSRPESATCPH